MKANPLNYDAWFDYIRLLEADANTEQVRDTYERAIANIPPSKVKFTNFFYLNNVSFDLFPVSNVFGDINKIKFYILVIYRLKFLKLEFYLLFFLLQEKRHWRRYIYLWINYALYEELEAEDMERTRDVYKACLDIIPHKNFTFAKVWLLFAHFEVRQKNLQGTRRILVWNYLSCNSLSLVIHCLDKRYSKKFQDNYRKIFSILSGQLLNCLCIKGTAIGKCPKNKLYRGYIELELQLREFERCRILYEKFLEFGPENCTSWMKVHAYHL